MYNLLRVPYKRHSKYWVSWDFIMLFNNTKIWSNWMAQVKIALCLQQIGECLDRHIEMAGWSIPHEFLKYFMNSINSSILYIISNCDSILYYVISCSLYIHFVRHPGLKNWFENGFNYVSTRKFKILFIVIEVIDFIIYTTPSL